MHFWCYYIYACPMILYSFIKPCFPYWNNKKSHFFYKSNSLYTYYRKNSAGKHEIKWLAQRHNYVRLWINSCGALNYNHYQTDFNPLHGSQKHVGKSMTRNYCILYLYLHIIPILVLANTSIIAPLIKSLYLQYVIIVNNI